MKTIKKFGLTKLLVAACIEFHDSVVSIISTIPAIVSALGDTLGEYKDKIVALKSAANKETRLTNTRAVTEKDNVRDALLSRFFKYVTDYLKSPLDNEKSAAQTIEDTISRFRGLVKYEMNKETGEIKSMIDSLRPQPVANALLTLGLDSLVQKIEDANNDFISEMTARVDGEAKKSKLNTREQQSAARIAFDNVTKKINAIAILTPSADSDKCIDQINALIDAYDRTISHMRSGGAGNESLPKKDVEDSSIES